MDKRIRIQLWLEFFMDLFCIAISNVITFFVLKSIRPSMYNCSLREWGEYIALLTVSFLAVYFCFHLNINTSERNRSNEFVSLFKNASLIYLLFAALLILTKNPVVTCRFHLVVSYVLLVAFSAIGRYVLKRILTGYYSNNKMALITGVLTTRDRAEEFVSGIQDDWSRRVTGVALLDNFCEDGYFRYDNTLEFNSGKPVMLKKKRRFPHSVCDVPVIATDARFMEWIRSAPLDEVFINVPYEKSSDVQEMVEEMESMGITVHINVPTLEKLLDESNYNNINCRIYSGYPMATFSAAVHNSTRLGLKRIVDVVLGTVGCILSLPIIAITAIPLLIESPGPLIFKQERVGKNGRIFNIYKLRSMYVDADKRKAELMENNKMEGLMFKMDNDPRITKVGKFIRKFSIDELPQFFNVVKGDMSLVGTRPPTVDEFEQYESRHKRRLSMRPGITGMWQVSGRSNIQDFEEVVRLDCKYIDEWSPLLDIKILFKTVGVVLFHKGAE